MAETVGSLIDKLSIVELRRWHTEEIMLSTNAPVDLRHECALRLRVIDEQRRDLIEELGALWTAISTGERTPKVYRQLKMYNDAALRAPWQEQDTPNPAEEPEEPNVVPLRRK